MIFLSKNRKSPCLILNLHCKSGGVMTIPCCRKLRKKLHEQIAELDALIQQIETYEEALLWE